MKIKMKGYASIVLLSFALTLFCSCNQGVAQSLVGEVEVAPASDPLNEGGWVLNEEVSDEFEGKELNREKWFIEGQDGDYYIWKGRPPSQFAEHNAIVEDGKLKIRTQWEPDFEFVKENYSDGNNNDKYGEWEGKPFPVTTAGVITKKRFLNGYMEAKTKTGNAAITGAFWAIGYEQELDVFEQMGNPKATDGKKLDIEADGTKITIHDWSPPAKRPTWVWKHKDNKLPFRTADEFHVFGVEWGIDYLKYFMDGKLVAETTQDELGSEWVLNNPMEVWFDSEIFKWLGLPTAEELPVDFEIDYVRVWQKPTDNLLPRQFYGFEGPLLYEENERPLKLLPESSIPDEYQKFWIIDTTSANYLVFNKGDYHTGVNSLEFVGFGKGETMNTEKAIAISPEGAIDLPSGAYKLTASIYLEQGHIAKNLYLGIKEEAIEFKIDLTTLPRRQWVTIEKTFSKKTDSTSADQFIIEVRRDDVPKNRPCKFYLDDIEIEKVK